MPVQTPSPAHTLGAGCWVWSLPPSESNSQGNVPSAPRLPGVPLPPQAQPAAWQGRNDARKLRARCSAPEGRGPRAPEKVGRRLGRKHKWAYTASSTPLQATFKAGGGKQGIARHRGDRGTRGGWGYVPSLRVGRCRRETCVCVWGGKGSIPSKHAFRGGLKALRCQEPGAGGVYCVLRASRPAGAHKRRGVAFSYWLGAPAGKRGGAGRRGAPFALPAVLSSFEQLSKPGARGPPGQALSPGSGRCRRAWPTA